MKQHTEPVHIHRRLGGLGSRLFGRHEQSGAGPLVFEGQPVLPTTRSVKLGGVAEVDQDRRAVVDEHVHRGHVAVSDLLAMQSSYGGGDLTGETQRLGGWKRALDEPAHEALTRHQHHGDEGPGPISQAAVIQVGHEVWMSRGSPPEATFLQESKLALGSVEMARQDELEGDVVTAATIEGPVHPAHTSVANDLA